MSYSLDLAAPSSKCCLAYSSLILCKLKIRPKGLVRFRLILFFWQESFIIGALYLLLHHIKWHIISGCLKFSDVKIYLLPPGSISLIPP